MRRCSANPELPLRISSREGIAFNTAVHSCPRYGCTVLLGVFARHRTGLLEMEKDEPPRDADFFDATFLANCYECLFIFE